MQQLKHYILTSISKLIGSRFVYQQETLDGSIQRNRYAAVNYNGEKLLNMLLTEYRQC